MSYTANTGDAYEEALEWAEESVSTNLSAFQSIVDNAAQDSANFNANQFVDDATTLMVGVQRDAARIVAIWGKFATELIKVEVK